MGPRRGTYDIELGILGASEDAFFELKLRLELFDGCLQLIKLLLATTPHLWVRAWHELLLFVTTPQFVEFLSLLL